MNNPAAALDGAPEKHSAASHSFLTAMLHSIHRLQVRGTSVILGKSIICHMYSRVIEVRLAELRAGVIA
jgi:hypothetical protein